MDGHQPQRRETLLVAFFVCASAAYYAAYFVLGERFHIMVWDSLDAFYFPVLLQSGMLHAPGSALVPQLFNGIPRSCLPTDFSVISFLYQLLPTYAAIAVCKTLAGSIGFLGLFALLKRYAQTGERETWIAAGAAACFATLPTPLTEVSSAIVPLCVFSFANIACRKSKWWDWLILATAPLLVEFVFLGMFLIITVGCVFIYCCIRARRIDWPFFFAIVLFSAVSLGCDYRLLEQTLFGAGFVPHRVTWKVVPQDSLAEALRQALRQFLNGQEHIQPLHKSIVLPVIAVALLFYRKAKPLAWGIAALLAFIMSTALLNSLVLWKPVFGLYSRIFSLFPVQLRFFSLYPACWYIAFGLALLILVRALPRLSIVIFLVVCAQLAVNFAHHEERKNASGPSYAEFFAQRQFAEIKAFIGLPQSQYRVVCVGLYPSVASYNGFYTLDGYVSQYPLRYKLAFREIIAPELDKSPAMKSYFDDWGSRAFVFSAELFPEYVRSKQNPRSISLDLNYTKLYAMEGRYILSSVPIVQGTTPHLSFLRLFTDPDSYWNIYLYQVLPQ